MTPQKAIIDTATRVIKRLTIDIPPPFDPTTETLIPLISPIVSLNGFQVLGLDNKTLTPATQLQVDTSKVYS